MLKKWIVLACTVSLMLTACNSPVYNQTENNVADAKIESTKRFKQSDKRGKTEPSLSIHKGSYVDKTPISVYKHPSWLKNKVVIRGDDLPFSYYARTISSGGGSFVLTKYQTGLDKGARVSISYSGTVKGALELLAAKTGNAYSVNGSTIYWKAFLTKTFDIAFMPGSTDYLMGKIGGGSGGGQLPGTGGGGGETIDFSQSDDSNNQYSSLMAAELSVWKDLETALTTLLSKDGQMTVSQATTSVTVRDRPSNLNLVSQYIKNLNTKLAKQVLVKIQVLEIDLTSDYSMGIDWSLVAKGFHNSPFVLNGNYGTPITISNLSSAVLGIPSSVTSNQTLLDGGTPVLGTVGNGNVPSYTILLNALSQQGKTSVVSEPRVVCLNNQVSVVRIVTQEGYVASVSSTTQGDSGNIEFTITPGSIITGVTLYVLPKIMDKKVFLQINADLSVKKDLVEKTSGNASVQLPTVARKNFNQRSMIRSGDTLVLSGFRQVSNRANAQQFLKSQALGGKASEMTNTETVLLITPIILDGGVS